MTLSLAVTGAGRRTTRRGPSRTSRGRADVVPLGPEPGAQASEAPDHLVGAEQDAVAVAELAHALGSSRPEA